MGKRVLVIDDEKIAQKLLSLFIKKAGYEAVVASSAQEGMELINESAFDLVTCDWLMPEEDGLSFLKRLMRDPALSHIPVVMVSAAEADDDLEEALQFGARAVLKKPVKAEMVTQVLSEILGA